MDSTRYLYGILVGVLPSLLWLWFWLKENNLHPEPRSVLRKCFFGGMLGIAFALLFQWIASLFLPDEFQRYTVWAAIEEVVKFGAVYFFAYRAGMIEEPIDAMIYMITAALGFATLENVLFVVGIIDKGGLVSAVIAGNLRFIGATLVHTVASAMVGFGMALSFYSSKYTKSFAILLGLGIATVLHTAFNLSIINAETVDTIKVFAWVWVAAVILILIFEEIKGIEIKQDAKHHQAKVTF